MPSFSLRDIVLNRCRQYYTLDIIDGLCRVSDEVSSTFQGPPGLDGMKVSDPRGWPRFHYKLLLFLFRRALFPHLAISFVVTRYDRTEIRSSKKSRACSSSTLAYESKSSVKRTSNFFVLSGCAGRARNEGRKRRSGIACKSYASSSIYPPSNPIRLTRDIVRVAHVYRARSKFTRVLFRGNLALHQKVVFWLNHWIVHTFLFFYIRTIFLFYI